MASQIARPDGESITADHDQNHVRRAARGSVLNLAGAVVSAVGTFGLTVLVTHGATKSEAGVFFSATSLFVLIVAAGQLGTNSGLVYFVARAKERGTLSSLTSYARTAIAPVVIVALVIAIAVFALAPTIAALIVPGNSALGASSLRALAWFVPLAALETATLSATRGLGTMRPNVVLDQLLRPALQIVLAAAILFANVKINLSWSWAIPYGVAGTAAWLWWQRLVANRAPRQVREPVAREFWKFSAPRSLAGLAQVALQRLDIVLVGAMAGASAAALYTAATRFVVLGQMSRNAVSLAVQPQLAAAMTSGSTERVKRLYQLSTAWLMGVSWPIYLVLLTDSSPLLGIFGADYRIGGGVLTLLSAAMLVATFCGDVDVMLIMSGRTRWSMINICIAFGLNLCLDLWLIPLHGIAGAAVGWAVAIVLKSLVALIEVAIVFGLHPVGRGTIIVALASAASFCGSLGAGRLVFGEGLVGLFFGGVVGCVAYGCIVWRFRKDLALDAFLPRHQR